jgi:NhaP-type Na+/H+ or K+/H+ antiporter
MLFSLALIFLLGLLLGSIFNKLKLPSLMGMLLTGMILGPYALHLLDSSILLISPDLRKLALVIILTRAGLALNLEDLKKVGRPAILMSFLPALCEIAAITLLAPLLFDSISIIDGAVMGCVLAAVSPAVIVPRMLRLTEEGYGKENSIPQLVMAGASVDDIFVIVLFTSFTSLALGGEFSASIFTQIPISIILGIGVGIVFGLFIALFFKKFHLRDSAKTLIMLSLSFIFVTLETQLENIIPFSGLLAIMSMSATLLQVYTPLAKRLSGKFSKLWVAAEILLFVLVGATVDIQYALSSGFLALVLVAGGLIFRFIGVLLCLIGTKLTKEERLFCAISYLPKATVQAAIGALPLAMGLESGNLILTVAVLAIILTAPIGAFGIDTTYKKLLKKSS